MVVAGGCLAPVADRFPPRGDEPAVTVWVLDHGWHTAIVVRRADLERARWSAVEDFSAATFIEVAWGDRDFYMAASARRSRPISPRASSSSSISHAGASMQWRALSTRNTSGTARAGLFASSAACTEPAGFMPRAAYHLFNTCNTWVARALRAAGLPLTPAGVITRGALLLATAGRHGRTGRSCPFVDSARAAPIMSRRPGEERARER
jgi:hypothetical protein